MVRLRKAILQMEAVGKKFTYLKNATYIVDIINLTFTVVLIREGHKVPSRKGASLPCNPVIHMILPI